MLGDLIVTGSVQTHRDANVQNINASNSITASTIQTSSNIEVRGDAVFKNDVKIDNKGTFGDITVMGTARIHELKTDIVASDTFSVDNLIVGDLVQISDKSVKKNIETLDKKSMLEKVKQLRPVSFDWKRDNSHEMGFIAQEVKEIFPEFVSGTKDETLIGVKYSNMVSVLVACIQDLQEQIDAMKELKEKIYRYNTNKWLKFNMFSAKMVFSISVLPVKRLPSTVTPGMVLLIPETSIFLTKLS